MKAGATPKDGASELREKLMQRRVKVDTDAIHFIACGQPSKVADARNSIFKLSQRFKMIPDRESTIRLKQILGTIQGEDEQSGDEDWEPSYKRLPANLKAIMKKKLEAKADGMRDHMCEEMKKIEEESATMSENGSLTRQSISVDTTDTVSLEGPERQPSNDTGSADEDNSVSKEFKAQMAEDFMKDNLSGWFEDIQVAYTSGVKIVKVNALGHKFIRILTVTDTDLQLTKAYTKSQAASTDRQIELTQIEDVVLGKGVPPSKEFQALSVVCRNSEAETDPCPLLCCLIMLPKGRTLSLVFLDEERRNAFVFFLRILIRRNLEIEKEFAR